MVNMMNILLKKVNKKLICGVLAIAFLFSGLPVFNNPGYVIARAATETTRLPITTYTRISGNLVTYTTSSLNKRSGYICSNDLCKITRIYGANSSCQVQYPTASGTKTAYASMNGFFQNVSFSTSTKKIGKRVDVYRKSSGYATVGTVYSKDYVTIIGTENGRTQIIYPVSNGAYKMGYISGIYNSGSGNEGTVSGSPEKASLLKSSSLNSSQIKSLVFDYRFYANKYYDLKKAFGYNENSLWQHFVTYGISEGRAGSPVIDASFYLANNADIANAFGKTNFLGAINHFINDGYKELRNSSPYYNGAYYRNKYMDLQKLTAYDLAIHYVTYGISEKRIGNSGNLLPDISTSTGTVSSGNSSSGIYYSSYNGVNYTNQGLSAGRVAALDKAKQMCTITWTSPCKFPTWRSSGGVANYVTATDGTRTNYYVAGKTYQGVPYSMSDNSYDDTRWNNLLKNGITTASMSTARSASVKASTTAHGVDCSRLTYYAFSTSVPGYGLKYQTTSRMLNSYDYIMKSMSKLKPGDIALKNGHVMLYVGRSGNNYAFFEANADYSRCVYTTYTSRSLNNSGYKYYKFRGFTD